jgi:hypothetical protein
VRAVLVGAGSGLLVGVVALVALVGFGWPVDHRTLTTATDTRPVVLPQSFLGLPSGGPDMSDFPALMREEVGDRPTQLVTYGGPAASGGPVVNVVVSRSWTSADSDLVTGPTSAHGAVECRSPVTLVFEDPTGEVPGGEMAVDFPIYCERRTDVLTVSALVMAPRESPPFTAAQVAAEVDAVFLAHR